MQKLNKVDWSAVASGEIKIKRSIATGIFGGISGHTALDNQSTTGSVSSFLMASLSAWEHLNRKIKRKITRGIELNRYVQVDEVKQYVIYCLTFYAVM
jgi:hypothetical protein